MTRWRRLRPPIIYTSKLDGTYYQLTGTVEFESLFQTGQWSDGDAFSLSDAPVAIRFADQYLLFLNGAQAAVYNGYAAEGHASTAYYALPAGVTEAVQAYLLERGAPARANASAFSTVPADS